MGAERWLQIITSPPATEPSPQGRGAGRALSESSNLLQTPKARNSAQRRTGVPSTIKAARMYSAQVQEKKVGRSAQFDATICAPKRHNFRLRHEKARGKRRRRERSRRSARGTCPAQRSSQADKGRRSV